MSKTPDHVATKVQGGTASDIPSPEAALLKPPTVEGNWLTKAKHYFSASSSRQSAVGYFAGDFPVLTAGILAGNSKKTLGGIAGLFQSFFLGIDKAKDPVSLDGMLTLLDKRLDEQLTASTASEALHLRPVEFAPKKGGEAAIDLIRSHGTELASASMVAQGFMTTLGAFSNKDKQGKSQTIWGDVVNGVLNMVGFGTLAISGLLIKAGFKFPDREFTNRPIWSRDFWRLDYLKDLIRSEPSNLSGTLAMASSTAGLASGLQFLNEGKIGAGISQLTGSGAYLYAETKLMGISDDEKKKIGLVTVDSEGKETNENALAIRTLQTLEKRGLLKADPQHNDALLKEVAAFYASCTALPAKHQDTLAQNILGSLQSHLATPVIH